MKPRPTKIQFGATHWNPNGKPDWYKKAEGRWMGYSEEDSRWIFVASITVSFPLIPVEELMAQPPEWNGEGLPPVGTECEVRLNRGAHGDPDWYRCVVVAHHWDRAVFYCAPRDGYYAATPAIIRPIKIKSEREKAIEAMSKVISEACDVDDLDPVASRKQLGALYDKGYRRVGNE
jgi:hypothetical protein